MLINEIVSTCIIRYIYYSIQIINIINKDPPAPPRPVSPNYPRATPVPPHPHQWCSGGGATGAIAPIPIFKGGAPLQFLFHLILVNFTYILQKLSFDLDYYW